MCSRLHSAAENSQRFCISRCQELCCHRRHRRRAQFGDQTAVHHRQWLAGIRAKNCDDGLVRRNSERGVAGINIDQLRSHDVAVHGGHDSHQAVVLRKCDDATDRLHHPSGREIHQRAFHRRDQVFQAQDAADRCFVEEGNGRCGIRRWVHKKCFILRIVSRFVRSSDSSGCGYSA